MRIGNFEITRGSSSQDLVSPVGQKKSKQPAHVTRFRLSSADGWHLELRYVDHAMVKTASHVGVSDYSPDAPKPLHRLKKGLRLTINKRRDGTRWAMLKQARFKGDGDHSNLYTATEQELSTGAGLSVRDFFRDRQAEFGSIKESVEKKHKFADHMCIVFPDDDLESPIAAYVLTRVLPLLNSKDEAENCG